MAKVLSIQVRLGLCALMRSVLMSLMSSLNVVGEIYRHTTASVLQVSIVDQRAITYSTFKFQWEARVKLG